VSKNSFPTKDYSRAFTALCKNWRITLSKTTLSYFTL